MNTIDDAKKKLVDVLTHASTDDVIRALVNAGFDIEIRVKDRDPPGDKGGVTVVLPYV